MAQSGYAALNAVLGLTQMDVRTSMASYSTDLEKRDIIQAFMRREVAPSREPAARKKKQLTKAMVLDAVRLLNESQVRAYTEQA